jgi:allantoinase
MKSGQKVIRSRRVVIDGEMRPATIAIEDERIAAILEHSDFEHGKQVDFGNAVIMPGIVDSHVHINEPGRSEWEGFRSATLAAAAGGVTSMIEMPLNSIPAVTTREAFAAKTAAANGKLAVDVGFWGGVVSGNVQHLREMHDAGAFGFKCFLVPSGVPEFEAVAESDLRQAMPELAALKTTLLVHSEVPGPIEEAVPQIADADPRKYSTWLRSRPAAAEDEAIAMLIRLSKEFGTRVHVVHLSSASAMPMLRRAKTERVKISVETCPHYLAFAAEDIRDGATELKCAPPIRERENQERLWDGVRSGFFDLVASDHSPAPPDMKCTDSGDFMTAWGGIASLQITLPIMWTGAKARGVDIPHLAKLLCSGPAKLAGLTRKGAIAPGRDADFVVWQPEQSFKVDAQALHHRHKLTPYAGHALRGVVQSTFLRGEQIFDSGSVIASDKGRVLLRGNA